MRRRVVALLLGCVLLAGCGSSGATDQQDPPPQHPNSNQNPGYDGSG